MGRTRGLTSIPITVEAVSQLVIRAAVGSLCPMLVSKLSWSKTSQLFYALG